MACSSGCASGPHATYGACLRAKGLQVAGVEAHAHSVKQDHMIRDYVDARNSGMQPETLYPRDVAFARKYTDRFGVPYRADVSTPVVQKTPGAAE